MSNLEFADYFIRFLIRKHILSARRLIYLQQVCKSWRDIVESGTETGDLIRFQIQLREKLQYDKSCYDQLYYKRLLILNALTPAIDKYRKLEIPQIVTSDNHKLTSDLGGMAFIQTRGMPNEFKILLQEYQNYPVVQVRLYGYKFIDRAISIGTNQIRDIIISGGKFDNMILFVPIMFSRHFRIYLQNKQYITIACYINVIDPALEQEFPDESERFIVFTVELENISSDTAHHHAVLDYIKKITESIQTTDISKKLTDYYYVRDIVQESRSLLKCYSELYNAHQHNF